MDKVKFFIFCFDDVCSHCNASKTYSIYSIYISPNASVNYGSGYT